MSTWVTPARSRISRSNAQKIGYSEREIDFAIGRSHGGAALQAISQVRIYKLYIYKVHI